MHSLKVAITVTCPSFSPLQSPLPPPPAATDIAPGDCLCAPAEWLKNGVDGCPVAHFLTIFCPFFSINVHFYEEKLLLYEYEIIKIRRFKRFFIKFTKTHFSFDFSVAFDLVFSSFSKAFFPTPQICVFFHLEKQRIYKFLRVSLSFARPFLPSCDYTSILMTVPIISQIPYFFDYKTPFQGG